MSTFSLTWFYILHLDGIIQPYTWEEGAGPGPMSSRTKISLEFTDTLSA